MLWTESYAPFGKRLTANPVATATSRVWFTGALDDPGSGLTYLGARFYDPSIGRFTGVDPVDITATDFASFGRYTYANNNPFSYNDPQGDIANFVLGGLKAGIENAVIQYVEIQVGVRPDFSLAELGSDTALGTATSGLSTLKNTARVARIANKIAAKSTGTYTNTHASGTRYHGKGSERRMKQSASERAGENKDPVVQSKHTPASSQREAYKEEQRRIDADGGPGSGNYNKINSPGKKYLEDDGG